MKFNKLFLGILLLLAATGLAHTTSAQTNYLPATPDTPLNPSILNRKSEIRFKLLKNENLDNKKNLWKISYGIRTINYDELAKAFSNGVGSTNENNKIGTFIRRGKFKKKKLNDLKNQEVIVKIPLKKLLPKNATAAIADKQVFLLYGQGEFLDAQTNRKVTINLNSVLSPTLIPNLDFGLDIEIKESKKGNLVYGTQIYAWKPENNSIGMK